MTTETAIKSVSVATLAERRGDFFLQILAVIFLEVLVKYFEAAEEGLKLLGHVLNRFLGSFFVVFKARFVSNSFFRGQFRSAHVPP